MPQSRLTGSRIRERRLFLGQKQSKLAKAVGISAAYLNLIEHNRRRIGGKLLQDIARELDTDPMALTEGAEAALLGALREAGQRHPEAEAELHRAEDLAGRFPGWSSLVATQHQRVRDLESLVEALSDRLTHDPELAASLHEVISAVTAIRSTAAILSEGGDVDPDWQSRFLRNLREEGRRLSGAAQGLVEYLDAGTGQDMAPVAPGEELAVFLDGRGHHLPELEAVADAGHDLAQTDAAITELTGQLAAFETAEARGMARRHFDQYLGDAAAMPLQRFQAAVEELGPDLSALATRFSQQLPAVMRRLAFLPQEAGLPGAGIVSCDGSGALVLRKALPGFAIPRFGAACPYWPLYQALSHPGQPCRAVVEQPGPTPRRFLCMAICLPKGVLDFKLPPTLEAVMLILPEEDWLAQLSGRADEGSALAAFSGSTGGRDEALPVGSTCRVCPRTGCLARREASILSGAR